MKNTKTRVAIVTNVIASYREDFYSRIFAKKNLDITVYCQSAISGMNLKTAHQLFKPNIQLINSISLNKEKLAWQFLPLFTLYRNFDVIFIYGNPRVLSNVVYSILLKVLGKKVVIWGQAHTAGANPTTEKLRLAWWRLFDYVFLYTEKEVDYLRNKSFHKQKLIGMNNGLNQDEIDKVTVQWNASALKTWQIDQGIDNKTVLLSCARLDAKNQFELMIPVLKHLQKNNNVLWCVIGQGEQASFLQDLVVQAGLTKQVRWLGAIYEESELAPWFLSSKALIHPGAIGLSLLHAFGYGLPVITHDNIENQMPEIAALKEGINGLLFKQENVKSLTKVIQLLLSADKTNSKQLSLAAYQTAKQEFNTQVMAERFNQIATLDQDSMLNKVKENIV